jgi:hypothetical protein
VASGSFGQSQGGRQVGHFAGRARLGWEPLRQLHDELVKPIAVETTQGAWYRQWRLVSLDGSTLDVADEKANEESFGRPGASRGNSAYPQIRFVALLENGTHVLFGSQLDVYEAGEITLAKRVLPRLRQGMLCLADRNFFGFQLWKQAQATGAELLWRVKKNMRLECENRLPDGSYLSRIYQPVVEVPRAALRAPPGRDAHIGDEGDALYRREADVKQIARRRRSPQGSNDLPL